MNILSILRKFLIKPPYQPLIEIKVFRDSILHNLQEYKTHYPSIQFAPVLKSNAYGHGLGEVAEILDNQELPFFVVDSYYEALMLRNKGIQTPILILGFWTSEQILNNKLSNCIFGITSLEQLEKIAPFLDKPTALHLKIDTGMSRLGIQPHDLKKTVVVFKSNPNLKLEGACTHFADAENIDSTLTNNQIVKWNETIKEIKSTFPDIKYWHVANTAGVLYSDQVDANVCRLGIGLYGIDKARERKLNLKPALQMESVVGMVKDIPKDSYVGYGATYTANTAMRIASVPVGYNEGVDRRLSSRGFFKVAGTECPIIGRVSMNMTTIDITGVSGVKLEEKVVVISVDSTDKNSVENMSKLCGCLAREILVHIPASLRRTVV